jgi:hypothetical protein
MTAPTPDLHGNLRVDVLDSLGGRLLGHGRLLIEPAPLAGLLKRARLEPDPQLQLEPGPHVLMLPSGEPWPVELLPSGENRALAVIAGSTPNFPPVGGE